MRSDTRMPAAGASVTVAVCVAGLLCLVALVYGPGCVPSEKPYLAKPGDRPEPVYCFDAIGHKSGSKPFILGGTCCCTPTKELMDKYHADGLLKDMTLEDLLKLYRDAGIKTALDHKGCNNLCEWGPHVVKGGKCMVPPTPGTSNYEEVRFGLKYVPVDATKTAEKKE